MINAKLFLFDLDGTLVSTGGAGLKALSRCFEELFGIKEATRPINPSGKTDPAIFREMVAFHLKRSATDAEMNSISESYLKHLAAEIDASTKIRVLTGVLNFLDSLLTRGDVILGLGTGNLERGARLKLKRTPLNSYFPFGGFGSDAEDRAEVLKWGHRKAEAQSGRIIPHESVFIVGDTPLDIAAARKAGFGVIAVASGLSSYDELLAEKPDHVWRDMGEGIDLLHSWNRNPGPF